MLRRDVLLVSVILLAVAASSPARAATFTGLVKSVDGAPVLVRAGSTQPVSKGTRVHAGDRIRTGPKGAVGIVFSDDTLVSMGPNTEFVIDDYRFEPLEGQLAFVARIVRGTVSYLSGQIAKLSPASVKLSVPTGTVGVRGTYILISVP